jgi:hypothetical protein
VISRFDSKRKHGTKALPNHPTHPFLYWQKAEIS